MVNQWLRRCRHRARKETQKSTDFARELNANTADDTPMQNES
jgi:hypothetical protein